MRQLIGELSAGKKAAATRKARNREKTSHLSTSQLQILKLARSAASSAIVRARSRGIPADDKFGNDLADILEKQDWRCALTALPFSNKRTSEGAGGRDYAPSPDRRDPARGYTAENVQWILWAVNRAKGRMSQQHFLRVFCALGIKLSQAKNGHEKSTIKTYNNIKTKHLSANQARNA